MIQLDLWNFARSIRTAGPWIGRFGAVAAALICFGFVALLGQIGALPRAEVTAWGIVFPVGYLSTLLFAPVCAVLLWWIARTVYLFTGHGYKIGIAYDSHKLDPSDWQRTCATLRRMLQDSPIATHVSIKLVPLSIARQEQRAIRFARTYRFTHLYVIEQTEDVSRLRANTAQSTKQLFRLNLLTPNALAVRRLVDELRLSIRQIRIPVQSSELDFLRMWARSLHDIMLLHLAAEACVRQHFDEGARILKCLDATIASWCPQDQWPRSQVRQLAVICCLHRTSFAIKAMPDPDVLDEIVSLANQAEEYVPQFPHAAIQIGRVRFLSGDVRGAQRITEDALGRTTGDRRAVLLLNQGFLNFIDACWKNASDSFRAMAESPLSRQLQWPDLVDFIDLASEQGYEVSALQVMYRRFGALPVSEEIASRSRSWREADASRSCLSWMETVTPKWLGKPQYKPETRSRNGKRRQ